MVCFLAPPPRDATPSAHMPGNRCRGVTHAIESSCLRRRYRGRRSRSAAACDRGRPPERSRSSNPVPSRGEQCGSEYHPQEAPLASPALAPPPLLSSAGLWALCPRPPELRISLRLGHPPSVSLRQTPRLLTDRRTDAALCALDPSAKFAKNDSRGEAAAVPNHRQFAEAEITAPSPAFRLNSSLRRRRDRRSSGPDSGPSA